MSHFGEWKCYPRWGSSWSRGCPLKLKIEGMMQGGRGTANSFYGYGCPFHDFFVVQWKLFTNLLDNVQCKGSLWWP